MKSWRSVTWRALFAATAGCAALWPGMVMAQAVGSASVATSVLPAAPPPDHYSVQTQVKETLDYDSNPLLSSSAHKTAYGSITTPDLTFNADTPTEHLDADLSAVLNRYNLQGFDSNDLHSKLHANHQDSDWSAGLGVMLDYDTTRTSEWNTSGRNVAGIRRTAYQLAPQWSFSPTPVDLLSFSGSYASNIYSNTTLYTNYDTYSFSPSLTHVFDPQNSGVLALQTSRYQTTSGSQVSFNGVGFTGGWRYLASPTLTLSGDLGMQRNEGSFTNQPGTLTYDMTADASATWKGQQDTLSLTATRSTVPQASGTEAETTSFTFSDLHQLSPRLDTQWNATYQFSDYPGSSSGTQYVQKSYANFNPHLIYHLTEEVKIDLSYLFKTQVMETLGNQTGGSQSSAHSQAVLLSFIYAPLSDALKW
ncbi:MAG TPA: hypothetical protein VM661_15165 [Candidatus Sulfotelmatobacter sp.]|jgi:hypothetical protein|nr:hypothetical protein [Candidatus Sulfotelmatobacter sp.]